MRVAVGAALVLGVLALAVLMARDVLLQAAGDFLIVGDPLAAADAVIAISGNGQERAEEAVHVLEEGYARWLILSGGPAGRSGSGQEMRHYALRHGAPPARILLDETASSTYGNAEGAARVMRAHGLRSAILVTSPYHMRRSLVIFRSVFGQQGLTVRAHPVPHSFFEPEHWWTRRQDRFLVVSEYKKLLAFLVGIR